MPAQTRLGLQQLTSLLISDPSNQRWTAAQVISKLGEAQERFVLDTQALVANFTDTVVANQEEYPLQADVMSIKRMAHKGIELTRINKFDLGLYNSGDWTLVTGTPQFYYMDMNPSNKVYGLFPLPQGADAGAFLVYEYIQIPPTMSSDASVPFNGHTLMAPYSNALAYWAAKELLMVDPSQTNMTKMEGFNKRYQDETANCVETFRHWEESQAFRMRGGRYYRGM